MYKRQDYFRYNPADEFITPEQIEEIAANTKASLSGTGYAVRKPAYPELICFGTFAGIKLFDFKIAAFESPVGGFILVGIMAGMFREMCIRDSPHRHSTHF